jgi:hypothetical protein
LVAADRRAVHHAAAMAFPSTLPALMVVVAVLQVPAAPAPAQKNPEIAALEEQIAGKEQLPAENVFKNVQTFKGRPAIGVLRIMEQAFVANLGVECSYCHVDKQYESDDKKTKGVAREMWIMRAKWQDEAREASGNPKAVVTCYTCHKGKPKPEFAPGR